MRLAALVLAISLLPALPAHADHAAPAAKAAEAEAPAAPTAAPAAPAPEKVDPALARDVRHLLELSGAATLGLSVMHQLLGTFRQAMPNVPAAFWDDFEKRVHPEDLMELMIPIYARHLSHAEVKALIRFYTSPTGRALVKAMPAIGAESQVAGKRWGMKIAQEAITALKAKGYRH